MRPTTRQSSQRVQVETATDTAPPLRPVAPSFVRANSNAAQAAGGLAQTLGITQDFAARALERRRNKANLSGTLAALEGREPTEEELQSDSFKLAFEQIQAERDLIDTRRELSQRIVTEFDNANGTADDLNGLIDSVFEESYGGLDIENDVDQRLAPEIVRGLEEIRLDVLSKFADDQQKRLANQVEANINALAQDDLERLGSIDYQDLNDRLFPLVGNERTNEIITSVAIDAAVTQGRPELLDDLPRSWGENAPGPQSIARFRDPIRNARIQAENQRLHNEKLADAVQVEALKLQRQQAEADVMIDILSGREITGNVAELIEQNILTPATARTLLNFQESQSDDLSTGQVNDNVAAQLEVELYTGIATITDVIEAASEGRLGNGSAMKEELSRLMRLSGSVQTVEEQRLATPEARRLQTEIKSLLTPKKDAFGNPNDIELQTQAEAMRVFAERVGAGEEPSQVRNEVLETASRRRQATPETESAQDSPEELLRLLEAGAITDEEFDSRLSVLEASL